MHATDVPNSSLPAGSFEPLLLPFGVALACAVLVLAGVGLFRFLLGSYDFRGGVAATAHLTAYLVLLVGTGVLGWHWHESAIQAAPIFPGLHFIESLVVDLYVLGGLVVGGWAAKVWLIDAR